MPTARPAAPSASTILQAIDALRAAGESGDADAVAALLARDVVLHSPMSAMKVFEGREEVAALHHDIFDVLENLETDEALTFGDTGAFVFRARVRGVELEAMNLLRTNGEGQIVEYTVYVRPLPALVTLLATLPPRVAARRRGPLVGALVASIARPLAIVHRVADRMAPRLL